MIWHLLITPLVTFLNALYSSLPVWNADFGESWVQAALYWLAPLDKFVPLHDGLIPLLSLSAAIFLVLLGVKVVKWLLSLVPTISSAG